LDHDGGRSIGIQEQLAQDLADGLVGAAVVALGPSLVGLESLQTAVFELLEQLVITLATIAIFGGHSRDVVVETFAFEEHEEAAGGRVVGEQIERSGGTAELVSVEVEVERFHEERIGEGKVCV
jgi:hypothetical protein